MKLRLKEIRTRCGMGQQEVADRAGMPIRRYGSYERGERTLSLVDAAVIADVFGCSLDELAGRDFRPEGGYSDPRQAELNRCWESLDAQNQDVLLINARNAADARGGPSQRAPVRQEGVSA